jgi:hypothetical protein
MKLPIKPDSESVRCAGNHLCRTLIRLTPQLMSFQSPALCCHRDPLLPRHLRIASRHSFVHQFSSAVSEIADARVFGGIHFRTSRDLGNTLGRAVANFVATHALRPLE